MDHEMSSSVPVPGIRPLADLTNFVLGNADEVSYCRRHGVHGGTAGKLRGITSDRQYQDVVVPALEECNKV
ncbi:hypothetical protein ACHAWF_000564, partial [Thalassiosira exigua]